MKLLNVLIAIILMGIIVTACANPQAAAPAPPKATTAANTGPTKAAWEQKWETVVAEGKREGGLTIYTSWGGEPVRKVLAAFADKYGIKGDVLSARGPELLQRMQAERTAGINSVDIVMAGITNLVVSMKPQGYLDRIEDVLILPEVTDPKAWRTGGVPYYDKQHYALGMISAFNRYCLINTDLVKAGEITSYKDLLQPKWKGKIAMNDPSITGAANTLVAALASTVWGMDPTLDFLRGLVKQDLVVTRDNRQLVEWVSKGKYQVALAPTPEQVSDFLKAGAPISLIKVAEGGKIGAMTGGLAIASKRQHPNAAVVYVNWLLSDEGHAVFVKSVGLPGARSNAPTEGIPATFFPEPGEKYYLENEETSLLEIEMVPVIKEILTPVIK